MWMPADIAGRLQTARGRTRTGTGFPPRDFKSLASTDFATRAPDESGPRFYRTPRAVTSLADAVAHGAKPLNLRDSRAIVTHAGSHVGLLPSRREPALVAGRTPRPEGRAFLRYEG
jgi:hypothetical protein